MWVENMGILIKNMLQMVIGKEKKEGSLILVIWREVVINFMEIKIILE